jgi:Mn2+/Fe2+ NRAMP family transporter
MQFYLQSSVTDKGITMRDYHFTRLEVFLSALFSNLVSWFIILTTAATLFVHGISVDSAEDAALALAPLAGRYASALFAIGLLGASALAAAVLPLSTSYAICEAFGWEMGIDKDFGDASLFYGLYTGIVVVGALATLLPGISLVMIMLLSQAVNGFLLPAILILMIRLANNRRIMGNHINGRLSNAVAWFTAVFVALTTAFLFVNLIFW